MLKWTLYTIAGLAILVGLAAAVGLLLPKGHRASRTATYQASAHAVYATIADVARFPEWRTGVTAVEILPPDSGGRMRFRENGPHGVITYLVETQEPPSKLVTRIDDPSLPFGGTWTLEVRETAAGTALTITEDGEVYNPIFRLLSKTVFSPYATIDAYQADLRRRLGA